jgi:hypothetical protein
MSIEITPELQEHINLLRGLTNITNVVIEPVPDGWKDQINNVDSVLFKIYKNEIYMDLVVPNSVCYDVIDEQINNEIGALDSLINSLIDKMSFDDCVMCVDNEKLESFYYMNPETGLIMEVENVISKNERTSEQEKLIELLHTVEFVREVFLYEVVNNSEHLLLACNIVNLQYSGEQESCPLGYDYCPPHGTRYKVLLPVSLTNDVDLHQNVVDELLKWYENTVNNIQSGFYSSEHQHYY